jgi:hypothetical protein
MRNTLTYAAFAAVAAVAAGTGCSSTTTTNGPTILAVTPAATNNGDGTYTVDLTVDFDDSADTGDLVDAYTFQTDDGQVDDVDVSLPAASASPFMIDGLILQADEFGSAALGFHLTLYGATTGLGSVFDGTITVN